MALIGQKFGVPLKRKIKLFLSLLTASGLFVDLTMAQESLLIELADLVIQQFSGT